MICRYQVCAVGLRYLGPGALRCRAYLPWILVAFVGYLNLNILDEKKRLEVSYFEYRLSHQLLLQPLLFPQISRGAPHLWNLSKCLYRSLIAPSVRSNLSPQHSKQASKSIIAFSSQFALP